MTCTLIIIDGQHVTVRHNIPKHPDMVRGLPWVYVDEHDIKYYPVWSNKHNDIYVVEAKPSATSQLQRT